LEQLEPEESCQQLVGVLAVCQAQLQGRHALQKWLPQIADNLIFLSTAAKNDH
jgi:hypothetical protein